MSNSKKICEQAENLLDKVKLINEKYEKVLNAGEGRFNIFSILRNDHDEVNLHSKFIYELINPLGSHNQGDIFLKIFLKQMNIELDVLEGVRVNREYKFIDILIRTNNRAIIIENKIWAGDQDKQLKNYHEKMTGEGFDDKNIDIVYLTLYGVEPDDTSYPSEIKLISYREDINKWLDNCIREAAALPKLREALFQYQSLIQKITGIKNMNENITDIKKVIVEGNNLQLAENIGTALVEAKVDIQFNFWKYLEKSLKSELDNLSIDQCTEEDIRKFYRSFSGGNYYGLDIKLPVAISGYDILYRVEVENVIFHGFTVAKNNERQSISGDELKDISDYIKKDIHSDYKNTKWWLGWKYPEVRINFRDPEDKIFQSFTNSDSIKKYTNSLAKEICSYLIEFNKKYSN